MDSHTPGDAGDGSFPDPVFDTPSIFFAILDSEGTVQATNRAWDAFADAIDGQFDPEPGVNYLSAVDSEDHAYARRIVDGLRAVLDGTRDQFEFAYPAHTSEQRRWLLVEVWPFTQDGKRYATVAHADVTGRQRTERKSRTANLQLEAAMEAGAIGTWEWNIVDDEVIIKESFSHTFAVDPDSASEGVSIDQFIDAVHETDRERIEAAIEEAIETCGEYNEQYRLWNADGELRWIVAHGYVECDADGNPVAFPGAVVDITERKRAERILTEQHDELTQLARLNALVREILQALPDTETREEIETAICRQLTTSDLYQAAWIGICTQTENPPPTIEPTTTAGPASASIEPSSVARDAAHTAITREDVVRTAVTASEFLGGECGTLAAVPLATDETTYGVLVVYVPGGYEITDAERDVLADLGEILALAIQRVHSQRSLTADTTVELTLHIPDTDSPVGIVSDRLDCRLSLEGRLPLGDELERYYLSVRGTDPHRVCDLLGDMRGVESCLVVRDTSETDEPALLEMDYAGSRQWAVDAVLEYSGLIVDVVARDGDASLTVRFSPEVDVRTAIDAVRSVEPSVELTSKRLVDRSEPSLPVMQEVVSAELTQKQRRTLALAYEMGYYDWPRECTAEQLAETLSISAPTCHYRLRRAHQTVMELLFETPFLAVE